MAEDHDGVLLRPKGPPIEVIVVERTRETIKVALIAFTASSVGGTIGTVVGTILIKYFGI